MAIDISQIQLTDAERRFVAEVAERTGKPWAEVLKDALRQYAETVASQLKNGDRVESLYDRLANHRLIGCLDGGPEDLSTGAAHMEGFGESDS